jgi:hypothetical protein
VGPLLDEAEELLLQHKWSELGLKVMEARHLEQKLMYTSDGRSDWLVAESIHHLPETGIPLAMVSQLLSSGLAWATGTDRAFPAMLVFLTQARTLVRTLGTEGLLESFGKRQAAGLVGGYAILMDGAIHEGMQCWDKAITLYEEAVAQSYVLGSAALTDKASLMLNHAKQSRALGYDPVASFESNVRICRVCLKGGTIGGEGGTLKIASCGRCQLVFYCTPECQLADWKQHKPHCCKIDPERCCDACWDEAAEVLRCGPCRAAKYCSVASQKTDWSQKHKKVCIKKSRRRMNQYLLPLLPSWRSVAFRGNAKTRLLVCASRRTDLSHLELVRGGASGAV